MNETSGLRQDVEQRDRKHVDSEQGNNQTLLTGLTGELRLVTDWLL